MDKVVFQEIYEADNIVYGDSRFDTMKYQLFDFSKVKEFAVSESEVKIIAALDSAAAVWNNNIKLAIVAQDPYTVEMIRIYKDNLAGINWDIHEFEDVADAIEWCLK
jgi:hypothetical protein